MYLILGRHMFYHRQECVHEALKLTHPSRLETSGYHGSHTQKGKLAGTLSGCPVGSAMTTPFTFGTDTLDGLNDPLFSFTEMYEQQGFSLCLAQPGNWSGLYRIGAARGKWVDKIPLLYSWRTHQWILEIVIGEHTQATRFAKLSLIYDRRKCNTRLARELDRAYSIMRDDIPLVSAITSALAMPAANNSHDSEPHTPDPDDCNTHALKTGRFKSMTHKQLHETLGHFGYLGVSKRGYRYSIILRDRCTGTPLIVQKIEIATKRSMATTSTPVQYFCYHADHCVKVMARLPAFFKNNNTATI